MMFGEISVSGKNNRESHNNHHCKSERHQPDATAPAENSAVTVRAAGFGNQLPKAIRMSSKTTEFVIISARR